MSVLPGVLLVFTLMVGPSAAAQRFTRHVGVGVALAAALALIEAWGGLMLAYYTDWATSFWITALSGCVYFFSLLNWWPITSERLQQGSREQSV